MLRFHCGHEGRDLWFGVLHHKTKFKRGGLPGGSESQPVFLRFLRLGKTIAVRRGRLFGQVLLWLCFEEESRQNPLTGWDKLPINYVAGETLDSPEVHFVSGMSEDAKDQSEVIIAYEVNDCTPRVVKLEKSEIEHILFPSVPLPATTTQAAQKRVPVHSYSNQSNQAKSILTGHCSSRLPGKCCNMQR
jgi:hypothetical protein